MPLIKCPYCGKRVILNKGNGQCPHCLKIIDTPVNNRSVKGKNLFALEEGLFDHAGQKIKKLSRILFRVGIALSVLGGLGVILWDLFTNIIWGYGSPANHLAVIISSIVGAALGCILSWISSLLLYGFGEIVEKHES